MTQLRALALVLFALALIGASTIMTPPVVIVYPLTVTSGGNPEAGGTIAVQIAQRLAAHGGMQVRPAPPGTDRSQYLTAARAAGADYYVTGYLTALGNEASLILQVVDTAGGSVVQSVSAVVSTYDEAAGQSETLAQIILTHAGRALSELDNPQTESSDTPEPNRNDKGNQANLGALASLLHRRHTAAGANGERSLILSVDGDADADAKAYASRALIAQIDREGGNAAPLVLASSVGIAHAAAVCKANDNTLSLYTLDLSFFRDKAKDPTGAWVDIVNYDCTGKQLASAHGAAGLARHGSMDDAIDRAIAAAFAPPPTPAPTVKPKKR